jgi:two-component system nitrogen regulation response regulator GlnG
MDDETDTYLCSQNQDPGDPMHEVLSLIGQYAAADLPVLIIGETGTGKELVAHAIHRHSTRKQQPFLTVDCATSQNQYLESELFGHEPGGLADATTQRIGKVELCNRGTLSLVDIHTLHLSTQSKLTRLIQSGTFSRLGSTQVFKVDTRIIAATNESPERALEENRFRPDLFHHLNLAAIHIPPLRERKQDILHLTRHFLSRLSLELKQEPKSLSDDALQTLRSYDWPGNVDQLKFALHHAFLRSRTGQILPEDFPSQIATKTSTTKPAVGPPAPHVDSVNPGVAALAEQLFKWAQTKPDAQVLPTVERALVICALKQCSGNQVHAAKLLGITRATLRKRIEHFDIQLELTIH